MFSFHMDAVTVHEGANLEVQEVSVESIAVANSNIITANNGSAWEVVAYKNGGVGMAGCRYNI